MDISKMFLQVLHKDKDALRFLRQFDPASHATIMRMNSVSFGVVCSPFQAIWVVLETAKMFSKSYPEAAKQILQNIYMDDLLTGAASQSEAKQMLHECALIFGQAKMKAHKFSTNCPEILASIPDKDKCPDQTVKVLGAQ